MSLRYNGFSLGHGSLTCSRTLVKENVFIAIHTRASHFLPTCPMLSFPVDAWNSSFKAAGIARGPRLGDSNGRLASQITPRLYLSDYRTARDVQKLKELGISHIISLLEFPPDLPESIPADRRLHIAVPDNPKADILRHLRTSTSFIIAAFNENSSNKVLVCSSHWSLFAKTDYCFCQVHCMMGVSRSTTVVCAYLVATTNVTAAEAIAHVQSIRGVVNPNLGFRRQLETYRLGFVKSNPPQTNLVPNIFKHCCTTPEVEESG